MIFNIIQSPGKLLRTEHCTVQDLYVDVSLELHTQEHVTLTSLPAMQW
jgi:hypothetical protein